MIEYSVECFKFLPMVASRTLNLYSIVAFRDGHVKEELDSVPDTIDSNGDDFFDAVI